MAVWVGDGVDVEERYECCKLIGRGCCSRVYQGRIRETGEVVAIKKLLSEEDEEDDDGGIPNSVIREFFLLQNFRHPNIVELRDVHFVGLSEYNLVFEYIEHDLHHILRRCQDRSDVLPVDTVLKYAHDLLSGVHACHTRRIVHRDLKPQNLLVGPGGLKICDFGMARMFDPPIKAYTFSVVALWYRAPELLLGAPTYGPQIDVWSSGCCISELVTCEPLFPGDSDIGTIFRICRLLGSPTEETWPGIQRLQYWKPVFPSWPPADLSQTFRQHREIAEDHVLADLFAHLLGGLLRMDPDSRISAGKAAGHALFKDRR